MRIESSSSCSSTGGTATTAAQPPLAPAERESRWAAAKALGQAFAVASLYQARHPVAKRAIDEAQAAATRALESGRRLAIGLGAAGWLVDGALAGPAGAVPEALGALFKGRGWSTLSLWPGLEASELAALCELAAESSCQDRAAGEAFLRSRGVLRIALGLERPGPALDPPPQPARPAPPAAPAADRRPFTTFLQALVERSGAAPVEQARLYREAVELLRESMKEVLQAQIAAAQQRLDQHAAGLVAECKRTQRVLASVAEGRVTVDGEGRVLMMNPAAEQIAGKRLGELAGRSLAESMACSGHILSMTLSGTLGDATPRVLVRGEPEAYDSFRRSVALVCDSDGRVVGTYGILPNAALTQETAKLQEDFVSRVTHELKAPLTAISAALELIEERGGAGLAELERGLLETSQRNADRLRRLIDDLLDFESLQNGKQQLALEPCEAAPLVAKAVATLKPWAESKQIGFAAAAAPEGLRPILADGERIVQVLTNLLSNALKSTPPGGQVDAGVLAEGTCARFWVRDTGRGIAPEDQRRIFEKFVQLEGGRRDGVGLGLAIVADLVSRHQGKVGVRSELGKGAVFSFTIPFAPAENGKTAGPRR
ncbi:MAG: hypothetical protein HY554_08065 [Elusimicrobia bacterium]|nr:hypothetical protein [Elusimicrobiota bacterium]